MTASNLENLSYNVAVIVPCYNEEKTIKQVVNDFQKQLPYARIYVYDNNSTDNTVKEALIAGAIVRKVPLQGKGNVVRRMFADIDADVYVMVDGDATYDSRSAPLLIQTLIDNQLDMINGARVTEEKAAYRMGHTLGNKALTGIVSKFFGKQFNDMLSGYRVFSRRYVKSFPCLSTGFEIETELTVHALSLRMPIAEVATPYFSRPEGSFSKLSTYKDGFRILKTIIKLVRGEKPLLFFSSIAMVFVLLSLIIGIPVITEYFSTGLVPKFPSAILSASLMVLAWISFYSGLILDNVTRSRLEAKQLAYLAQPICTSIKFTVSEHRAVID
jgi:glycosyltransferase involved in cell wall biosynthesis